MYQFKIKLLFVTLFFLIVTGCTSNKDTFDDETNWENGQGDLPNEIGNHTTKKEAPINTSYADLFLNEQTVEKTEYQPPMGKWFLHNGSGVFGYELPSGTKKAGEKFTIQLFSHHKESTKVNKDIRIQLTERDNNLQKKALITEETMHLDAVKKEAKLLDVQLPHKENVVYILSLEFLDKNGYVEDTMISTIYVPTPEVNAKLSMDKDVYTSSDEIATILLKNSGPTFLKLGKHYSIEKKVNDKWKVVPLETSFEEIGILLNPSDGYEQKIQLDSLAAGKYRIIKTFGADGLDNSFTLADVFTVE